jgi:hypothetical protein
MKSKVSKYLSSKEKKSYTQLDFLFEMYLNGMIEKELTGLSLYDVEIFAYHNKGLKNSLQLNFKHYNLVCTIDFFNERYEYIIYAIGDSFNRVKDSFTEYTYDRDFSISDLIQKVYSQLKDHSNLKDNTQLMIKQKKYKMISSICLAIPCVIIGVCAVYVFITKETIKLNPFFMLIIVIPIILWDIFYIKAVKIK